MMKLQSGMPVKQIFPTEIYLIIKEVCKDDVIFCDIMTSQEVVISKLFSSFRKIFYLSHKKICNLKSINS